MDSMDRAKDLGVTEVNTKYEVVKPITFGKRGEEFATELRKRVDAYFDDNRLSPKANWLMITKSIVFVSIFFFSYYMAVFADIKPIYRLFYGVLFGCNNAFIAFNIGHDASHNAYSNNNKVNSILAYAMNFVGISQYIWNIKHNLSHHTFTNIPFADMDNENVGVARITRHHKWKPIFKYQHIYLPILWPFFALFLILVKDFQLFSMTRMGNSEYEAHPPREWLILFITKIWTIGIQIVIPIMVIDLPVWQILLGLLAMYASMGTLLTSIFLFVHLIDGQPFPEENEKGEIEDHWILHQLKVTTDYAPFNPVLTFMSGALNQHVAHHVFPHYCHVHYGAITRIIKDTAKEYGYEYKSQSFFSAFRSHIRFLKQMGQKGIPVKLETI
jgi:linoleoyl-CoA desaturase